MANALENAICDGVDFAHKEYENMTGYWLWHAPESFLTTQIAMKIYKKLDFSVYIDTALSRIARERAELGIDKIPGPRPAFLAFRPDISVWAKSKPDIRAAIEVKRSGGFGLMSKDVFKLQNIIGKPHGPKSGYVLVHTTASQQSTVETRIITWAKKCHTKIVKSRSDSDGEAAWGYALLRI